MTPSLALPHSVNSAARTTWAPGWGSRHGRLRDRALDGAAQQPVPRGVELDLVDPVAVAVVGAQDRRVALGAPAVLGRLDAAGDPAGLAGPVDAPAAALALQRLAQRQVGLEQVDRLQRRGLVEDLAGGIGDVDRSHHAGAAVTSVRSATRSVASWVPANSRRESCARRKNSGASCSQVAPIPPWTLIIERAA